VNFYVEYKDERERAFHHVSNLSTLNIKEHSFCVQMTAKPYKLFLTPNCNTHENKNYKFNKKMIFGDIKVHKKKFGLKEYNRIISQLDISKRFMLHITNVPFATSEYKPITEHGNIFGIIKMFYDQTDELFLEIHNKILYPYQEKKFKKQLKNDKEFWLQYFNVNTKIQYFSMATELANDNLSWHICKPLYQDKVLTNFK
jgi:hypothetical protein